MAEDEDVLAFGPVQSRRLGVSVGVNAVPPKTCTYSCVYCQLGKTTNLTVRRHAFFSSEAVAEAVMRCIDGAKSKPDYVTLIGHGEPSLASNFGEIRDLVADQWDGGTALLTNGALLWDASVREAALGFDVVLPTVSSSTESMFKRMHRPHPSLSLEKVMGGITSFSDEYKGALWFETMLVAGINDDLASVEALGELIRNANPDCVHVTAPIRPPTEPWVRCPSRESIELALRILPRAIDSTMPEGDLPGTRTEDIKRHVLDVSSFHPLEEEQALGLIMSTGRCRTDASLILKSIVEERMLERREYAGRVFYAKKG